MNKIAFYLIAGLSLTIFAIRSALPGQIEQRINGVEEHAPYVISEAATKLHESLFIVDTHSDSMLWGRDLSERAERGHVDLPRLQEGNVGLQVFSATTKSPRGQNYSSNTGGSDNITLLTLIHGWPTATWTSLFARADHQLDKLHILVSKNPNEMIFVRNKENLNALLQARKANKNVVGAMYLIEGSHALDGNVENLNKLQAKGLHFVGLTHFFDNKLGGSLHGINQQGLTEFGRSVIQRANELEMTVDIAHASPQMVKDVLALSTRPVLLSHGGFKGACNTDRNLEDELMRRVAEKGGIIGVGYWPAAVCDASPKGIVKSIRYGIGLMGLEHIALGSDYDGGTTTTFDTSELAILTQTMLDEGFTEREIRAVMGENMKRFLQEQLPAG